MPNKYLQYPSFSSYTPFAAPPPSHNISYIFEFHLPTPLLIRSCNLIHNVIQVNYTHTFAHFSQVIKNHTLSFSLYHPTARTRGEASQEIFISSSNTLVYLVTLVRFETQHKDSKVLII